MSYLWSELFRLLSNTTSWRLERQMSHRYEGLYTSRLGVIFMHQWYGPSFITLPSSYYCHQSCHLKCLYNAAHCRLPTVWEYWGFNIPDNCMGFSYGSREVTNKIILSLPSMDSVYQRQSTILRGSYTEGHDGSCVTQWALIQTTAQRMAGWYII